jgi:malate dehydrogenase (quinone)
LLGREEIARIEPKIVEERKEPVAALCSEDGYAINFKALAESFVAQSKADVLLGTKVLGIKKENNGYTITAKGKELHAKVVVVSAGAHSLLFAQALGYGHEYIIFPTFGDFFTLPHALNNKVYTMQIKRIPFAAIHGDPDVVDPTVTRFGPTSKVLPFLERRNKKTFFDFMRLFHINMKDVRSIIAILSDPVIRRYVVRNMSYYIPLIGKRFFMREVRKIVPSARMKDLKFEKKLRGLRPQLVDTNTRKLVMGEAKIVGERIIFNMTPSPGATVCLKNAQEDARTIVGFLGGKFDEKRFLREHS